MQYFLIVLFDGRIIVGEQEQPQKQSHSISINP